MRLLNQLTQRVEALDLSRDQRLPMPCAARALAMVSSINTLLDRQQEALERERNLANEGPMSCARRWPPSPCRPRP
jgi:two-component system sensor histidine kinase QseC